MLSSQHPPPVTTNTSGRRQRPDSIGDLVKLQEDEGPGEVQAGEDLLDLAGGESKGTGERVLPPDISLGVIGGDSSCQGGESGDGVERGRRPQDSVVHDDEATAAIGAGGAAAAAVEDSERWCTVFPERGALLPGEKMELRLTVLVSDTAVEKPRTHDPLAGCASISHLSLSLSLSRCFLHHGRT